MCCHHRTGLEGALGWSTTRIEVVHYKQRGGPLRFASSVFFEVRVELHDLWRQLFQIIQFHSREYYFHEYEGSSFSEPAPQVPTPI